MHLLYFEVKAGSRRDLFPEITSTFTKEHHQTTTIRLIILPVIVESIDGKVNIGYPLDDCPLPSLMVW